MFDGCFEDLRSPFRAVAQAVCVAALALLSLAPHASGNADRGRAVIQSTAPQTRSIGILSTRLRREGAQRRTWVVRLNLFELRIERDSSRGSDSWSVTILTHEPEDDADSTLGTAQQKCI